MGVARKVTMGGLLAETAARFPERDALVYWEQGVRYSYRQLEAECRRIAKGLLRVGVRKGDHVAIWAHNVPEWVLLQFATAKIGAVLVTVNTSYRGHELEYLLQQSDSSTLFLVQGFKGVDYVQTLLQVVPELATALPGELQSSRLPRLRRVVFLGSAAPAGMLPFAELAALGDTVAEHELDAVAATLDPDEVINMQYTSGTTGFPKGVMLSHYNIVENGRQIGACMRFTAEDRLCIPVPLFHCFGCVLGVLACVTHGAAMVPLEAFEPRQVLATIEKERCTAVHGVPTMFIAELEHPDFASFDLSSLRTGIMAGSPCPIEVMKRVISQMHAREITIAYGQTESSPVITQTRTDDPVELRVSTVGRALPDVEVKIVDPASGATLPPGEAGEICTRGYLVMQGYYKQPEETAAAIDADGWLHTGDLGVLDERGYCKITGRIKNIIIRGGECISPREIEEFLYTHPAVSDVQVYGVPDRKYGEQVMAAIILKPGAELTVDAVREFCRGELASYKVPKYVTFVTEFPMTANGKVQKFKLREMAVRALGLEEIGPTA